ncbi:MAG: 1-deoxy-D-xylulose-5-phosphate reductoisomerase [Muribaculaceae bacterium]|nr:1-deoxy-D-xylulose-5-phosphate reductoisomerase [Muribaculaceae bacterium]
MLNTDNNKPKNIAVLGSTGSIGTQTLDIIAEYPDRFKAHVLVAGHNVDRLIAQSLIHRPALAVIADEALYPQLREALAPAGIATAAGPEAICSATELPEVDTVLTATVGYSGLAPTIHAIKSGKEIALANKETLVVAGELITGMLRDSASHILPVDSEHSAIYQCLVGEDMSTVARLIITASGGPFRTMTKESLKAVTVEDALRHPNWRMGAKITIDSATMLNKAFEIIEAHWLFGISADRIEAVVHPQSIVHSMVQFTDGAVKAQLGLPDMHLPIRYALGDATRLKATEPPMRISDYTTLTFERPDTDRFPCLNLAYRALSEGGTTACAINAANEVAVDAFLKGRISFLDIYSTIEHTIERTEYIGRPQYEDYVAINNEARRYARERVAASKRTVTPVF